MNTTAPESVPRSSAGPPKPRRWRGRLLLLGLVALFAAPLLVASLMVGRWQPAATVHHGQLLDPPQPLTPVAVELYGGEAVGDAFLRRQWTLIMVHPGGSCPEACRLRLEQLDTLRLLMGKDKHRVQTLVVNPAPWAPAAQRWLAKTHPNLPAGVADPATLDALAIPFGAPPPPQVSPADPAAPAEPLPTPAPIYLVDPLGNLVMRYGGDVPPQLVIKDLKRLLKYTQLG